MNSSQNFPADAGTNRRWFRSKPALAVLTLIGITLLAVVSRFVYHTTNKSFSLTYFPGDTYAPARNFPAVDEHQQPRVVLATRAGGMECFEVYYSQKLKERVEATPGPVRVDYRVRYRFGHPFWIETLDVAGLGIEPTTSRYSVKGSYRTGNVAPGECF